MEKRRWLGKAIWFSRDDPVRGLQELYFVPAWALEKAMTQNYYQAQSPKESLLSYIRGLAKDSS